MSRLLLVEDDETIGGVLSTELVEQGHSVEWARTGGEALRAAQAGDFALVVLDLGLPDIDGIRVCRAVRKAQPWTIVVVLTARTQEMDVIVGLEAGADDYLTKPVRLGELLARLRAHLRRANPAQADDTPRRLGDLVLDTAGRRVSVGEHELLLRAKEFDLLARLARTPGVAITRRTLMADVWDENWHGPTKTLDVHMATLRRRLAEMALHGALPRIVTLRGHGYRLDPPA